MTESARQGTRRDSVGSGSRIRPGLRYNDPTDERLAFSKQLGVDEIVVHPLSQSYITDEEFPLATPPEWSYEELVHLRTRIEDHGLRLAAIENFPVDFYDDVMLGGPRRDDQLAHVKRSIRNVGRSGIPVVGYNWMPNKVWRTSLTARGRGGAKSTAFDLADAENAPPTHGREYTEEELWENYEHFLEEVLPVAEAEGVTLCLHPDDPPVERLGGIPRLFRDFDGVDRAMNLVDSDSHGLELCLGTWSEMSPAVDLVDVIHHFGERDEITYVHFRDVAGTVPAFREVFVDEGNYDEYEVLAALDEVGFSGIVIPDHVPQLEGEPDWHPTGRGYTVGYIKGMLKAHGTR